MSVLTASLLMVLLQKRLRNSGHRNSVVKSKVMKLQGVRIRGLGCQERVFTDRKPREGRMRQT